MWLEQNGIRHSAYAWLRRCSAVWTPPASFWAGMLLPIVASDAAGDCVGLRGSASSRCRVGCDLRVIVQRQRGLAQTPTRPSYGCFPTDDIFLLSCSRCTLSWCPSCGWRGCCNSACVLFKLALPLISTHTCI